MKLFFTSSENKEAKLAQKKYEDKYGNCRPEESDIIVPIGGDGFLNLHGGVLYCGPHQSSLYILDTDEPQLNPYDSELRKHYYGVASNFEGERSKWGLRLLYNIQIMNLKIFFSNSNRSQEIQSQLYGLEIFYKNYKKIQLFIIS